MKVIISSVLLLIIGVSFVLSQQCHMREVDLCLATSIFHYQSNGIPDDDEKVTEWCEALEELRSCMRNFSNKCMSPLQKELAQFFTDGASDAERQLCTPGSEIRKEFLKHATCLVEASESDVFKGHVKDMRVTIETSFAADFKNRLPVGCCGFNRFLKGTEDNVKKMCGEDAMKMIKFLMYMIVTELPETLCQTYDDANEICQRFLLPSGTSPQGAESKSQVIKLLDTLFGN